MTRALRDEASGPDERGLDGAFASLSSLAAARAAFFGGEPIKALGDGLAAFCNNPSPANWYPASRSIVTIDDTARGGNVGRRAGTACNDCLKLCLPSRLHFN